MKGSIEPNDKNPRPDLRNPKVARVERVLKDLKSRIRKQTLKVVVPMAMFHAEQPRHIFKDKE
jgi:hypothetical protein